MEKRQSDENARADREDEIHDLMAHDLDDFTRAYIEAALWSSTETGEENPITDEHTVYDLARETLESMAADCARFQRENEALLDIAHDRYRPRDGYKGPDLSGHDFWLTRCGHGVGFWDRDELNADGIGAALTKASEAYGERWLYVGDDGLIYQA